MNCTLLIDEVQKERMKLVIQTDRYEEIPDTVEGGEVFHFVADDVPHILENLQTHLLYNKDSLSTLEEQKYSLIIDQLHGWLYQELELPAIKEMTGE